MDWIPRLSLNALRHFRQRVSHALATVPSPKHRVLCLPFVRCCVDDTAFLAADEEAPLITSSSSSTPSIHDDRTIISLDSTSSPSLPASSHPRLFMPGRIIHLWERDRTHTCSGAERTFTPVWKARDAFPEIIVSRRMLSDHKPNNYADALEDLV